MNGGDVKSLAIVCEADADRAIACGLADRVLCEQVDWITPEVLDAYRAWRGLNPGDAFLRWASVYTLAREQRIRFHGHFSGEPGEPDAYAARQALALLLSADEPPKAVVLMRDTDDVEARVAGLKQARDCHPWPFAIVIAAAHPKRECWILAAFVVASPEEQQRVDEAATRIGFHPCSNAHRLTAQAPGAKKNAKEVLLSLIQGDRYRENTAWAQPALDHLRQAGQHVGLSQYLAELHDRLVPLFR